MRAAGGTTLTGKAEKARERQMRKTALALFRPEGKNAYVFNGKPLDNLQDLADYLVAFTGREGLWVAAWLEYLGDEDAAASIRQRPGDFKQIVAGRCQEMKKYLR